MSTRYTDLFSALAAPIPPGEIKTRTQAGKTLRYITARTVMNRLDNVLGCENWWDDYTRSENSVLCRLSIRLPDGSTLTKADAGGYAGMADHGDDDKSGYSDSFKRAAVKLGVARELYGDGVPAFLRESDPAVETAPVEAPSTPETVPAVVKDGRSYWELVTDKAAELNDKFRSFHADADDIVDGVTATGRLLWLAWDQKLTDFEPTPRAPQGELVLQMDLVYKAHRKWVREAMKGYLHDTFATAMGKAGAAGAVKA